MINRITEVSQMIDCWHARITQREIAADVRLLVPFFFYGLLQRTTLVVSPSLPTRHRNEPSWMSSESSQTTSYISMQYFHLGYTEMGNVCYISLNTQPPHILALHGWSRTRRKASHNKSIIFLKAIVRKRQFLYRKRQHTL